MIFSNKFNIWVDILSYITAKPIEAKGYKHRITCSLTLISSFMLNKLDS